MSNSRVLEAPGRTAPLAATVVTVSLMGVLVVGQMYVTIPLMPRIADAWNVDTASAAVSTTAFALAHAVGSLLSGPLSDRWGRRTVMVGNVVAMAGVTALVPLASDLGTGVVLRSFQGLFAGSFIPMAYAYLHARVAERSVPLALTVVSACMGATVVVGQVQAQLLEATLGWTSVFWGTAPLLLAGAAVTWRVLLPDPPPPPSANRTAVRLDGVRGAFTARVVPLYLAILVGAGALTALYTGVQLYGPPEVGRDGSAMLALRSAALPALLVAVLLAPVLGRFRATRRAYGAFAVTLVAMIPAAAGGDRAVLLGAALFVFMLGFSTLGPALIQTVGGQAGAAQTTAIAVYGFTLNVGAGTGAQLAPLFSDFGSLAGALAAALAGAACCVLLSARHGRRDLTN
ncbi:MULTISPECIES: MFS transporter [unclassified Streptomyces]|uniref:MFS transporter n=1 Tax=unclassified Streptomyces TaxID=2593676 RepID=UPI0019067688|nr:MFS transporter [Streptomyces sp. HSG2]